MFDWLIEYASALKVALIDNTQKIIHKTCHTHSSGDKLVYI